MSAPRFPQLWAVAGSTLEAVAKKVGLLREAPGKALGGTLEAVLALATKLPVRLWVAPDPSANAKRLLPRILAAATPGTLVVLDAGA